MRFWWLLSLISCSVWAHQTSLTPSGNELFWANQNVALKITTNSSDVNAAAARSIILDSMAQWNASSSAKVNEASSSLNEIRFTSNFAYGSAVIGMTELSYSASGGIQKAIISLNDNYTFKSTPGLYPSGQVYLGDVVTHELGHLFGLSHSEVLNSTMFYSSFSGQSTVSLDDKTGIRQKYDSGYGLIYGQVQGGSHIGVLGVHVQAISRKSGEATAAITDESGNFYLGGLDLNDTYYIYTSPIKNPDSLPGYFSNVQADFCPATFKGSFFSACGRENDGKPQGITLSSSQTTVNVGVVSINCSLRSDEDYSYQKLQATFAPVTIFDYATEPRTEKAFVGWFRKPGDTNWGNPDLLRVDLSGYTVSGTTKYLKVSLVSFPFGTQLEYKMDVKQNGSLVTSASRNMTYSATTQTYNPDFESLIQLDNDPGRNTFDIDISAKKLENFYVAQMFPSASDYSSGDYLPYLVMVSLWENAGTIQPLIDSGASLSDNYACLDAPFTYVVSRTQESTEETGSTAEAAAAAGCGTIEPPQDGPGSSLPLVALGFVMALMPSLMSKSRKKFLS